jgi:hypothetical protein
MNKTEPFVVFRIVPVIDFCIIKCWILVLLNKLLGILIDDASTDKFSLKLY